MFGISHRERRNKNPRIPLDFGRCLTADHTVGAWSVPQPLFQTSACPPHDAGIPPGSIYTIGRTMFETDRLTAEHASRCNKMDEVWVPTEFHKVIMGLYPLLAP